MVYWSHVSRKSVFMIPLVNTKLNILIRPFSISLHKSEDWYETLMAAYVVKGQVFLWQTLFNFFLKTCIPDLIWTFHANNNHQDIIIKVNRHTYEREHLRHMNKLGRFLPSTHPPTLNICKEDNYHHFLFPAKCVYGWPWITMVNNGYIASHLSPWSFMVNNYDYHGLIFC